MITLNIKNDFSETPGGRTTKEGPFSGELFRDEYLLPKYEEAVNTNTKLQINFDDCFGFGTSFLEEAFGGLVRIYKKKNVLSKLEFVSEDDETIPKLITKYITAAENKSMAQKG